MYESALASVNASTAHPLSGSYQAQNCDSKLASHLSLPVEEEGRNKFQMISSLNQSAARHDGLGALPEIPANPSSKMSHHQQNYAKAPSSQSWGQKKGQNLGACAPAGWIQGDYDSHAQDQGLIAASSPPDARRLPKERQDGASQEASFRIEAKLKARSYFLGNEDDKGNLSRAGSLAQYDSNLRAREENYKEN